MKIQRILSLILFMAADATAAGFLPVQPGNAWFYRNNRTGIGYPMTVGIVPRAADERVHYQVTGYLN